MTAFLLERGRRFSTIRICGNAPVQTSLPYDEEQPLLSFVASSLWQFQRCLGLAATFAPAAKILSKNRGSYSFPLKRTKSKRFATCHAASNLNQVFPKIDEYLNLAALSRHNDTLLSILDTPFHPAAACRGEPLNGKVGG
jgi:hypothetical protein